MSKQNKKNKTIFYLFYLTNWGKKNFNLKGKPLLISVKFWSNTQTHTHTTYFTILFYTNYNRLMFHDDDYDIQIRHLYSPTNNFIQFVQQQQKNFINFKTKTV